MITTLFSIVLMAGASTPVLASCSAHTHLHARAEEGEVKISTFGYTGTIGPLNWHNLAPGNSACFTGTRQSPINMINSQFNMLASTEVILTIPDQPAGVVFENLGTTVEAVLEGKGAKGVIADTEFELKQFHFHHPSEHLDNGTSMPLEMHMVFQTADATPKIAVIGVYIDIDTGIAVAATAMQPPSRIARSLPQTAKPFSAIGPVAPITSVLLETLLDGGEEIAIPGTKVTSKPLVFSELVDTLKSGAFQAYSGSLTTPPCSESVSWNVATQKLKISAATFEKIRGVIKFNSRFPQAALGQPNILTNAAVSPVGAVPAVV